MARADRTALAQNRVANTWQPTVYRAAFMAATPLLAVDQLAYCYGNRQAVYDATFTIQPGEIFGFLGPNGAGKTTAISCIAGLLGAYTGMLSFRGAEFRPAERAADRRKLGIVPQELSLYEDLTARENLAFFGKLQGLRSQCLEAAVARALELAGLGDRQHDRVKTYSGGMKRRLNLAAGDLHQPELLLLDEPTVGVDPQSRNHLFESLQALRQSGRTLLYTTHYIEEAQRLCDRVAILNEGRIAGIGTAAELAEQAGVPGADLEKVFLEMTGRSLRDER
jgi:ABC-2 type transport system ATP-binding protein